MANMKEKTLSCENNVNFAKWPRKLLQNLNFICLCFKRFVRLNSYIIQHRTRSYSNSYISKARKNGKGKENKKNKKERKKQKKEEDKTKGRKKEEH